METIEAGVLYENVKNDIVELDNMDFVSREEWESILWAHICRKLSDEEIEKQIEFIDKQKELMQYFEGEINQKFLSIRKDVLNECCIKKGEV